MDKKELIYEGKAKKVFTTEEPDLLIQEFKDAATAFDGQKKGIIGKKGYYNNKISQVLFSQLEKNGIRTHFVKSISDNEMLIKKLNIFMIEVVVRNIAAGSLVKRLGMSEGTILENSILEFYYKNDDLHDPLINRYHVFELKLATPEELDRLAELAFKINDVLVPFFARYGLNLVDFKLEFGAHHNEILLGDEISPDTCRLWDAKEGTKLDKDRFRFDLGNVEEAYAEIYRRISQ